MLLNGYGYNWCRQDNRLRADDLLIRSRASEHLADAAVRLGELESRYRRTWLPPPTRQHPDPDPQHLAAARRLHGFADRIRAVETRLRGAAVPAQDKVWQRHRDELDTLRRLGECDAILIVAAKELADLIGALPAEAALDVASEQQIDEHLAGLTALLARRAAILAGEDRDRRPGGFETSPARR